MKKILISLVLLVPFLTGCADIDTRVTINDDKSASVVTSLTYQGDLANSDDINATNILSNYESFIDMGYSLENAYGAKLSTITATKNSNNLMSEDLDLTSLGFTSKLPSKKFIEIKKNFLVTSYNVDCVYDFEAQASKFHKAQLESKKDVPSGLQPEYYQKYGDIAELEPPVEREDDIAANLDEDTKQFVQESVEEINQQPVQENDKDLNMSFSIKVPTFASYNNADSVDGNVYTWNIKKDAPTSVKFQYVQYSGFSITFIILAGILLLILLAKKIIKHDSQKRVDNINNIV